MSIALHPELRDLRVSDVLTGTERKGQTDRLVEKMRRRRGARADVVGCPPHRFRHTVATVMLGAGKDIRITNECLAPPT